MVDRDPFIYEIRNFGSYWFFCGPKNKPTIRTTWFRARIDQVIRVGGASEAGPRLFRAESCTKFTESDVRSQLYFWLANNFRDSHM